MCRSPNPRILYVDKNRDECEMIGLMLLLEDNSFQFTAVATAQKALALMSNEPISLFILDYDLPEMTGVELCRRIRLTDLQTPILFYSEMARDIDRQKAIAAGANEYLIKPDDLEKFTETVRRLMQK